jgi:site-specific DNA-adenine methylase
MQYYGGKSKLIPHLVGYVEAYRAKYRINTFVDVCGGSGKIVMNVSPEMERVYNDIGLGLCCLMECIQDEGLTAQLFDILRDTPYSRENFQTAARSWHDGGIDLDKVRRSAYTYIAARQSIVGGMQSYKWLSVDAYNRRMVFDYFHDLSNLWNIHYNAGQFKISCRDWFDVLEEYRGKTDTLLFIDPPYDEATCSNDYEFNIGQQEHRKLVNFLLSDALKCKVILCGNYTPLYEPLTDNGWGGVFLARIPRMAARFTQTRRFSDEWVWTNASIYNG